ncbi:MAG: 2-haloacid dehalogenase [Natronomonas sp.]|jgi:2-haloacid dehalogenase
MAPVCFDMYGTLCDTGTAADKLADELAVSEALVAQLDTGWRTKQLQYSYQLGMMEEYRPFWQVTRDALDYTLSRFDLDPDQETRLRIMAGYEQLSPFPGAIDALETLRDAGHEVAVLSNGNPAMLETLAEDAGLAPHLDAVISADEVETYKPAPVVYENTADELDADIGDCRLVSANSWDVAGAGSAGMETVWINRLRDPFERIGPEPGATVADLAGAEAILR